EGPVDDASFALNHPEKVIDFGYRAVHEMTVQSKAIVAAFYGRAPRYSYWTGCSSGGKQGLKEAQQFPMDYDGILAGAPANFLTHLSAAVMIISDSKHPGSVRYIPPISINYFTMQSSPLATLQTALKTEFSTSLGSAGLTRISFYVRTPSIALS